MKLSNLLGVGAALSLAAASLQAATITVSDTEQQSGFNGATPGNDPSDPNNNSAAITTNVFNFTGQQQLSNITSVSISFTIYDGDTGLGSNGADNTPYPPDGATHGDDDDFVNTLHLRLHNIDTANVPTSGTATPPSLLLNGFDAADTNLGINENFIRRTITGTPDNSAAILSALRSGTLMATVFDAGFSDTSNTSQNSFAIPAYQYDDAAGSFNTDEPIFATLSITGTADVPEPNALTCFAAGGILLLSIRRRRIGNAYHLLEAHNSINAPSLGK